MTASDDSLKKLETDIRNCARELLDQGYEIDARATADEEFSWADRLSALQAHGEGVEAVAGSAGQLKRLVQEGLEYFDKVGDAGDKRYVSAIRSFIDIILSGDVVYCLDCPGDSCQKCEGTGWADRDGGLIVGSVSPRMHDASAMSTTHPPAAQAVPKALDHEPLRADESGREQTDVYHYVNGWNDCRDAMLKATPPQEGAQGSGVVSTPGAYRADLHKSGCYDEYCRGCISESCQQCIETQPYRKDGETPAQRIQREINDNCGLLRMLAAEKRKNALAAQPQTAQAAQQQPERREVG